MERKEMDLFVDKIRWLVCHASLWLLESAETSFYQTFFSKKNCQQQKKGITFREKNIIGLGANVIKRPLASFSAEQRQL